MQQSSAALKQRDGRGSAELTALAGTMRQSLAQMGESGQRLGATLKQLSDDGAEFGAIIEAARLMFPMPPRPPKSVSRAPPICSTNPCRENLLAQADGRRLANALREQVWPTYTMAAERTIHATVLRNCGIADEPAPAIAAADAFRRYPVLTHHVMLGLDPSISCGRFSLRSQGRRCAPPEGDNGAAYGNSPAK